MRAIDPEVETNLDFLLEVTLETGPNDLALTRLQPIHNRRNGTNVVGHGEQDKLTVDEVGQRDFPLGMVKVCTRLNKRQVKRLCIQRLDEP